MESRIIKFIEDQELFQESLAENNKEILDELKSLKKKIEENKPNSQSSYSIDVKLLEDIKSDTKVIRDYAINKPKTKLLQSIKDEQDTQQVLFRKLYTDLMKEILRVKYEMPKRVKKLSLSQIISTTAIFILSISVVILLALNYQAHSQYERLAKINMVMKLRYNEELNNATNYLEEHQSIIDSIYRLYKK